MERGTSLLEVLVVLIVISIFGAVSFSVGAAALENYKLDKAANTLVSDIRELQAKAMAENIWQQVRFFPAANKYRLIRAGVLLQDVQLEKGLALKSGNIDVSFYPSGAPSVGATIIIGNSRGKEVKVIIAPVTGRVRIAS